MKIAFYKAATGNFIDRLIDRCTERRGYSHCEFVFSDGMFFSSSPRDGGCRFKMIDQDPRHWDFVDLPLTEGEESHLRFVCHYLISRGTRYDFFGVLGFVTPCKATNGRMFCSESLVSALQMARLMSDQLKAAKVSPSDLQQMFTAGAIHSHLLIQK